MAIRFDPATGGFPSRVYHPVFGARDVTDANDVVKLGPDFFNTAEEADMHRTETEAQMVVHQNRRVKVDEATTTDGVVRNSVTATENLNAGGAEPL